MESLIMASFVKIENNGYISQAIVIADSDCGNQNYPESEVTGKQFIQNVLLLDGEWKQTSEDSSYRGMYASIGCFYDSSSDEFKIQLES